MMYRNSIKLLMSNFVSIWKILLFKVVSVLCVLGITATFALPLIQEFISQNFFVDMYNTYSSIAFNFSISNILNFITITIDNLILIVLNLPVDLLVLFICASVFIVLTCTFFASMYELPITEHVSTMMSCNVKMGLFNSMFNNFSKTIRLQLFRLITSLPMNIAIIVGFYYVLKLTTFSGVVGVISPLLVALYLILTIALKVTLFSGLQPAIAVQNKGIFKSSKLGLKALKRRFWRTFSTSIVIVISMFIINVFALIYTAGAGLIVTIPASILWIIVFGLVMYYGSNGMRYYVDSETILSPKKLEEQDTFNKLKYII